MAPTDRPRGGGPSSRDSQARRGLRDLYHASGFHHWRLGRNRAASLEVEPNDPWPGDADAGRALLEGRFVRFGHRTAVGEVPWDAVLDDWVAEELHRFGWLRDLRETAGDAARARARSLVSSWMERHSRWSPLPWRGDILGERVGNWIGLHDFFCASADDGFRERYFDALSRQAAHLRRDWRSAPDGSARFAALRGRVMASISLGRAVGGDTDDALEDVAEELERQIADDGGHRSRSPACQIEVLRTLIDIRAVLRASNQAEPEEITDAVAAMSAAARLMRHPDGGLALFHRSTEAIGATIDVILARSDTKRRAPSELPDTGYQRLSAGRTVVIVDAGEPSAIDRAAHASPLAFEMSSGRQRIVVNCGTSPGETKWESALRASAAHSVLVIDDRNSAEIAADGTPGKRPAFVTAARGENEDGTWIEGEHDGYVPTHGLRHRRRLFLSSTGDLIEGIDTLTRTTTTGDVAAPREIAIRFHLHPRIGASVVQSGASVLLRTPSGGGWRVRADGPATLNESVYFGDGGRLQRAEQIVLVARPRPDSDGPVEIHWSIRREDAGKAG